jgi:hypothetical protein
MSERVLRGCETCAGALASAEYIMRGKRLGTKRVGPLHLELLEKATQICSPTLAVT